MEIEMADTKGRPYTITDCKIAYRSKQMMGSVVFSPKEIASCAAAIDAGGEQGPKMAEMLMEAKHTFPGCFISEGGEIKKRKGKFEK